MAAMTVKVKIENLEKTIEVEVGDNLRGALLDNDIEIYEGIHKLLNCQGKGLCGTCVIDVVEGAGLSDQTAYEKARARFQAGDRAEYPRLACLTRCYQDCTIKTLPQPALVE
ncbi:2Fe-2S iron-sulfur cluster binding domain-containing protein [Candidatus Sumerlaeota bacterium]|nr:2Fe-2S iron-sulfur cluster binding domain-containing protein [Candidatus Sumerlaeota bacterium]